MQCFIWPCMRCMNGDKGMAKDDRKALNLFQSAANLDHADAYGMLGYAYNIGDLPGPHDTIKGKEYLELSSKKGSVGARTNLVVLAATTGNYAVVQL